MFSRRTLIAKEEVSTYLSVVRSGSAPLSVSHKATSARRAGGRKLTTDDGGALLPKQLALYFEIVHETLMARWQSVD